ncbi:hypothetical protein VTG60DRAFT_6702 [Thermothelomyces hinnuleus]
MNYTEEDLQDALAKYHRGGCSIRSISKEFGIPRATIQNRLHGHKTRSTAAESQQTLSRAQEEQLTQWVLIQVALGVPPTHAQIREFAGRILQAQGASRTTVGKGWMTRFLRRNPVLRTQKAFDRRDFELAQLRQENEALKAQLGAAQPSKRKVATDPNEQFASIEQIHQAQVEAGRIEDPGAEESGSESVESNASCIVVG